MWILVVMMPIVIKPKHLFSANVSLDFKGTRETGNVKVFSEQPYSNPCIKKWFIKMTKAAIRPKGCPSKVSPLFSPLQLGTEISNQTVNPGTTSPCACSMGDLSHGPMVWLSFSYKCIWMHVSAQAVPFGGKMAKIQGGQTMAHAPESLDTQKHEKDTCLFKTTVYSASRSLDDGVSTTGVRGPDVPV